MTKQEALYWKNFIYRTIEERVPYVKVTTEEARVISDFASRFMVTITGQQYLPQGIFREFLDIFKNIPAIQEEIEIAQEEIRVFLEHLPEPCTKKEVEQIFDGIMWEDEYIWLPSADLDEEGFATLNVSIDEEGYGHFEDE